MELPCGRILAMLRHRALVEQKDPHDVMFQSHSDDGGKTWSRPISSGISGYPAHLLRLHDGRLLCTAGHRFDPWGVQAVVSADDGRTWNTKETKIIRDDSLEGWTTYPMSSQLRDGSIFTTYGLVKQMPQSAYSAMSEPTISRTKAPSTFVYAAASIYRPDFVHSLDAPPRC
jgi:hypothetical protein